jgi:tetratricopeptide (TPR) repeat protein
LREVKELYEKGRRDWLEGRHLDALESYLSITEKGYGYCEANSNAAVILTTLGRHAESEKHFREAFATCPEDRDLLFNYSLHLMSRGDWDEGLRLYENRTWNIKPPGVEWDGTPCKTLLIVPEQGNGDCIQFSRFLPLAKARCEKLILMCFGSLVRLFESMGVADEVIEFNPGDEFVESEGDSNENVPYEKFARIMSIPHLCRAKDAPSMPFPKSNHETAEKKASGKTKVGICWRGHKREKEDSAAIDARRSMKFEEISPLLEVDGVEFHSLQKDSVIKHEKMIDNMASAKDFADTAETMRGLDLVISVDTAVAHLSAALGRPTWLLNRHDSCWRWGFSGDSTPWYPSMRIFRQPSMMDWTPVVEEVRKELERAVDNGPESL